MKRSLGGFGFEELEGFVERRIALGGGCFLVFFLDGMADGYGGGDGFVLNLLAGGSQVLGNGEEDCCAVWEFDGLLD